MTPVGRAACRRAAYGRAACGLAACGLVLAWSGAASAQLPEPFETPLPPPSPSENAEPPADTRRKRAHEEHGFQGFFAMLGPNLSLSVDRETGSGFGVGTEASVVKLTPDLFWVGGYADALYAVESEEVRISVGPELGFSFAGPDAGYLVSASGPRGTQHGLVVRPMLTVGIGTLYFRSAWLFGAHADWSGEVGLLLKLPIEL